jgi:hypothetical protein
MVGRAALPRTVRAGGFAVAALVLAGLAHRAGGGATPAPGALAGTAAGLTAVAYALAGRPRSTRLIAALVLASQLALHVAWQATDSAGQGLVSCVAHGVPSHTEGAAMTVFHALAAIAVAVVLQRGERWTFALVRTVARRSARRRSPIDPARPAPAVRLARRGPVAWTPSWRLQLAGGRATCGPPAMA